MVTAETAATVAWLAALLTTVGLAASAARRSRRVGVPTTDAEARESARAVRQLLASVVLVLILGAIAPTTVF